MKKTILIMGGLVLSLLTASVQAQVEPQPAKPTEPTTQPTTPAPVKPWDHTKNPTVVAITSKYEGQYIKNSSTLTNEDFFPVIGRFESGVNTDAPEVIITLDEQNKGIVWIEGIPQGRIKAMLRKSPSTYKIPAQKTEDGKDVAEGTLIFDKEANTLNMVIGKKYNVEDPSLAFATAAETETKVKVKDSKTKTKTKKVSKPKTWVYTGTKVIVVPVEVVPAVSN